MLKFTFPINRFAVFTTMLCAAVLLNTPNLLAQNSDGKYRARSRCRGGRFGLDGRLSGTRTLATQECEAYVSDSGAPRKQRVKAG
jgi:hypothetical protein